MNSILLPMTFKEQFISFLVEQKALRFGEFTTKSGRQTPYFINMGQFRTGDALSRLTRYYSDAFMLSFKDQVDNLFGPAYKGITLAAGTATQLAQQHGINLSFTYNRKEVKDHGEGGILVGDPYDQPTRILIVEDVITAGTAVRETMKLLQGFEKAQVCGLLVSVDRREKLEDGSSALQRVEQDYGIQTASIIHIEDIIDYLKQPQALQALGQGPDLLDRVQRYRDTWGI